MSSSGSGTRTVVESNQAPPQIAPEGKEGYKAAQTFFKSKLANPDIYGGERLAPVDPAQTEAINQQKALFSDPTMDLYNQNNIVRTLGGDYLNGPGAAAAVNSLTRPMFANFNQNVMPGLRDQSQFAGQGIQSTRRGVAENNATQKLGQDIAEGAVAPVYNAERDRMMAAGLAVPQVYSGEGVRTSGLYGAGAQSRDIQQEYLDTLRQIFEEPLYRQSEAASALLGGGVWGPGSSINASRSRNTLSTLQEIGQWVQIGSQLLSTAGAVAGFASTKMLKEDISPIGKDLHEMMAETMLKLPTHTWRYQWEGTGAIHVGPLLEDTPDWLREPSNPSQLLSTPSFLGALLVTVQHLNKRIKVLERKISELQTDRK